MANCSKCGKANRDKRTKAWLAKNTKQSMENLTSLKDFPMDQFFHVTLFRCLSFVERHH